MTVKKAANAHLFLVVRSNFTGVRTCRELKISGSRRNKRRLVTDTNLLPAQRSTRSTSATRHKLTTATTRSLSLSLSLPLYEKSHTVRLHNGTEMSRITECLQLWPIAPVLLLTQTGDSDLITVIYSIYRILIPNHLFTTTFTQT